MMKKIWIMLVWCSLLMIAGCSDKTVTEDLQTVSVEIASESMDAAADLYTDCTEQGQETSSDKEEAAGSKPVTSKEPTTEQTSTPEPASETTPESMSETVPEPTTPEHTTPEPSTGADNDESGNPEDGSPVAEITINRPEAEYLPYDANHVAALAIEECKAAGMITLPENLNNLLEEGKITQEEYNEYYPYDGCGYYSVFVETNLNLASTVSGRRLYSEEGIADYIAGMMVLEVEPYFFIECAGTYKQNGTEFYEFRCYR